MRFFLCIILTIFSANAEERILSYDSQINVLRDGFLEVTETIKVHVGGDQIHRGIYRDFPQDYKTKWGLKQHRPFEVIGVTRNDAPEPYAVEGLGSGSRIRIGSADVYLPIGSVQEYRIMYRTGRQLWFDDKGDELYWNVTGNFWNFPIQQASARVVLPEGIPVQTAEAYTGAMGAIERHYEKKDEADGVSFLTTSVLAPNEGLTIVVRWPPGKLDQSAYIEPEFWKGNEVLFSGLFVVLVGIGIFIYNWFLVGRDPAKGLMMPAWNPPKGFSPAAVRYLNTMAYDDTCFTAAVLSLASKAYLNIEECDGGAYKLMKRKGDEPLLPDEDELHRKLFENGNSLKLDRSNHVQIGGAKSALGLTLRQNIQGRYFHNHTKRWLLGLMVCFCGVILTALSADDCEVVIGFMIFAAAIMGFMAFRAAELRAKNSSILWITMEMIFFIVISLIPLSVVGLVGGIWCVIALLVVMILSQIFYYLMKAPTKEGRLVLDAISGFREYLAVAEEDRLNLENPPQRTPELFERFLPYALALGVEQKWSEKFDDLLTAAGQEKQGQNHYVPSFYTGSSSGFSSALAVASIGSAVGSALATSSIAPSSSGSSGYSGGGGSSGGGGGGGGGGGW